MDLNHWRTHSSTWTTGKATFSQDRSVKKDGFCSCHWHSEGLVIVVSRDCSRECSIALVEYGHKRTTASVGRQGNRHCLWDQLPFTFPPPPPTRLWEVTHDGPIGAFCPPFKGPLHMLGLQASTERNAHTGNSIGCIYTRNITSYWTCFYRTFVPTVNIVVIVSGGIVLFYIPVLVGMLSGVLQKKTFK